MKAIATAHLDEWLDRLARRATVFVPQANAAGDVVLAPSGRGKRAAHYRRLAESPKQILLPEVEDLLEFRDGRGQPKLDAQERILFGLRPCDAAAIGILDAFFARDYADPHYLSRRQRLRLIVSACQESAPTCFCISTQTGPVAAEGFDVQLFDLGEVHLAQAGSEEGAALLAAGEGLFTEPPADAQRKLEEFRRRSEASQQVRLDLRRAQRILREHGEGPDFWQKVADRCLMCGGCAYLCPTCTCSNLSDRPTAQGRGVRRRLWDSCMLAGFTREASGHNPRADQPPRCAHRYLHKLGGSDVPNRPFRCVGCGRCADACITRLGIIRVVQEMLASAGAQAPAKGP